VAVDSGHWRHGEAGRPVGEHRGGVRAQFEGSGEDGGSPGDRSMAVHLGGGETTVRGSSGGVGGVVKYCGATTELGVVEGHRFRGRTRLSPVTSLRQWKAVAGSSQGGGAAIDSPRGRKYLLGSEAGHTRKVARWRPEQRSGVVRVALCSAARQGDEE
jgi:hypothetical protein